MKIAKATVRIVEVPDEDSFAGPAERQAKVWPLVVVRLFTSDGIEGLGLGLSIGGGFIKPLAAAAQELADLTIGEDPVRVEAIHAKLTKHASSLGGTGIFLAALSAIDCALWDIKGKAFGLPLWKLLGGYRNKIPTYASGALHRGVPLADVPGAAERVLAHGFRYIKMHLALDGDTTPAKEVARAKLVREVVGPDIHLTIDVNERWSVAQAVDIGHRLEEVGLYWIEDPTRWDDFSGLAHISASLPTPTMAGESAWGVTPFRQMLEARSVDIVMIDVMHVGGITPWMKIAAMAEAFNIPVVSHIMPEFQAACVAAVPNGLIAEYKSWTWRLFEGCPEFADGQLILSDRPGHGLIISSEFKDRV